MKGFSAVADALGDRARQEVDAERARPAAGGGEAGTVERLGARDQLLAGGEQIPLLRQGDELGAVGGGGADQTLGGAEVAGLVGGRIELDGSDAHLCVFRVFHG